MKYSSPPLFYLDTISTTLLIIQGTADATSMPQSDELFTAMKRLQKKAEYVKYLNEGHGEIDWRYENQVDTLDRTLDWFDFWLNGHEDPALAKADRYARWQQLRSL